MKLTNNKNICPVCGKEFFVEPPVIPNTAPLEERDQFYGGRVHFFKDLVCDCTAEYKALIEKKLVGCEEQLNIIDMIIEKEGVPLDDLAKQKLKEAEEMGVQKALQAVHEAIQNNTVMPTLTERNKIKRQTILATVVDKDAKIETLMHMTEKELRRMCTRRKIKISTGDNKMSLAEKLLADDPTVVVPNPKK